MTIQSKVPNDKYREEYEKIFRKFKERHPEIDAPTEFGGAVVNKEGGLYVEDIQTYMEQEDAVS